MIKILKSLQDMAVFDTLEKVIWYFSNMVYATCMMIKYANPGLFDGAQLHTSPLV